MLFWPLKVALQREVVLEAIIVSREWRSIRACTDMTVWHDFQEPLAATSTLTSGCNESCVGEQAMSPVETAK